MAGLLEKDDAEQKKYLSELNDSFSREVWDIWRRLQFQETTVGPNVFYRSTALSLLSITAILAVDAGINDAQFMGMAKRLWDEVHSKAAKFS